MAKALFEFILRGPIDLHKRLKKLAHQNNYSLNSYCIMLLEKSIKLDSCNYSAWSEITAYLSNSFGKEYMGLVLFGSMARNEAKEGSDVDLLVVLKDTRALSRELYKKWDENNFVSTDGRIINPHFVHIRNNKDTGSIWFEVALDGIIIEDKYKLIQKKLIELRNMIAENKVRRFFSYGHPYWIKG